MALGIYTGGTTGGTNGTLVDGTNPLDFAALGALNTAMDVHFRCSGYGADDVHLQANTLLEVSYDGGTTWYAFDAEPAVTVGGTNVAVKLRQTTLGTEGTGTFQSTGIYDMTIDVTAPTGPTSVSAAAGYSSAVLTYSGASDDVGVTNYDEYHTTHGGSAPVAGTTPSTTDCGASPATITGLTPGTTYDFWIRAKDAANNKGSWVAATENTAGVAITGLIDLGFEYGVNLDNVNASNWTQRGTGGSFKISTASYKIGTRSALMTGTAGVYEGWEALNNSSQPAGAAGYRFWMNMPNTTENRLVVDSSDTPSTTQCYYIWFSPDGSIQIWTDRTATGYTTGNYTSIGTWSTGWQQYRIVLNVSGSTFTLSKRTNAGDSWTQLKAAAAPDYNIPMRGTAITANHNIRFLTLNSTTYYIDQIEYASAFA